jgi:DNA-binding NarL/FixJ family response regulator
MIKMTEREKQVLELLIVGLRDKDIAQKLGVSDRTAQHRATNVLNKLGADTRFQAGFIYGQRTTR